jgi:hypothetical protein
LEASFPGGQLVVQVVVGQAIGVWLKVACKVVAGIEAVIEGRQPVALEVILTHSTEVVAGVRDLAAPSARSEEESDCRT